MAQRCVEAGHGNDGVGAERGGGCGAGLGAALVRRSLPWQKPRSLERRVCLGSLSSVEDGEEM